MHKALARIKKLSLVTILAVNFEKFSSYINPNPVNPSIRLIRFGWLDGSDWVGQTSDKGQQSRLPSSLENYKLLQLYKKP